MRKLWGDQISGRYEGIWPTQGDVRTGASLQRRVENALNWGDFTTGGWTGGVSAVVKNCAQKRRNTRGLKQSLSFILGPRQLMKNSVQVEEISCHNPFLVARCCSQRGFSRPYSKTKSAVNMLISPRSGPGLRALLREGVAVYPSPLRWRHSGLVFRNKHLHQTEN